MAMRKQHRILIATDGSGPAQDALATALQFPWPACPPQKLDPGDSG